MTKLILKTEWQRVFKFSRLLTLIRTKSKRKIQQILTFKTLIFTVPLYMLEDKQKARNKLSMYPKNMHK